MAGLKSPLRERLDVGEPAWLTPYTVGCARECWSQPKVTVVALADPFVTVLLQDGREITTHGDNVRKSQPKPPVERRQRPAVRPTAVDCEEVPLW